VLENGLEGILSPYILPELADHLKSSMNEANQELEKSLNMLLSMCVLVPSAPYPSLDRLQAIGWPSIPSASEVAAQFPSSSRYDMQNSFSHRKKIEQIWANMLHGLTAYLALKETENLTKTKELEFHKDLYEKFSIKMSNAVKIIDARTEKLQLQWDSLKNPILKLQSDLASLELNPVKVAEFVSETEKTLKKLIDSL